MWISSLKQVKSSLKTKIGENSNIKTKHLISFNIWLQDQTGSKIQHFISEHHGFSARKRQNYT